MQTYATTFDLTTWTGEDEPPKAAQLLRSASFVIRRATRSAIYDVDELGHPSDPKLRTAFRDATCAQAAGWAAAGIDPTGGPAAVAPPPVSQKAIGTATIQYDTAAAASVTAQQARAQALRDLHPDAEAILSDAGLLNGEPLHDW